MRIVFDRLGRLRVRFRSAFDARLYGDFTMHLAESVSGIVHVRANPAARSLVIRYHGGAHARSAILQAIAETPSNLRPRPLAGTPAQRHLRYTLLSGCVFVGGLFLPASWRMAVTWVIAAPPILKGIDALVHTGLCVEALDSAALSIAMLRRDPGTAAATLILQNLGEFLEATTAQSSTDMLRYLLARPPGAAWVEQSDGQLIEVPSVELRQDDIIVVGPGDMIAVDGQVVSGSATVNEASITGESLPVDKEAGARVLSGGVVEDGRLRIRATGVGSATTTARISAFIEGALDQKPTMQSAAERLADRRVLFTLGLGALTFAFTRDFNRLASVFLVDYSCALKLGAPVAIKSALYRGAKSGILLKGGSSLEAMSQIDTVVFDKTGTLTAGHLEVTDVVPTADDHSKDELLALLASLEEHATHPVADAIVEEARRKTLAHINHDQVDFIVAHGLISEVDGQRVVVGSRHFLEEHEDVPFGPFEEHAKRLARKGRVLLYAAIDGIPAGIIGLRDHLRPESLDTVAALRAHGVGTIAMLTGDSARKANALARDLGLDMVFADQRPEDKARVVQALQAEGRKVAFIGDGVNDAPALVAADVGIAMPRGADLARATADIILLRDSLDGVASSRVLSDETVSLIRSNFAWAVALNTGLFVTAVTGVTSPVMSAMLHNGVTLGTLLRALIGAQRAA